MSARSMNEDDPLEDFVRREITLDGVTKRVYVAGSGPAVIVMSEMPGISRRSRALPGGAATLSSPSTCPSLIGRDGGVPGAEEVWLSFEGRVSSAEFRAMAANHLGP